MWTFTRPGTNSYWMAWSSTTKPWETSLARHGWGEFHRWDLLVDQVARLVGALGALVVNAVRLRSKTPMFFRCVSSIQNGGWSDGWWMDLFHLNRYDENWLVVWNIFYFPIYWEYGNHFNWLIFFRGVGSTTNQIFYFNQHVDEKPSFAATTEDAELHRGGVSSDGDPRRARRAGGSRPSRGNSLWCHPKR